MVDPTQEFPKPKKLPGKVEKDGRDTGRALDDQANKNTDVERPAADQKTTVPRPVSPASAPTDEVRVDKPAAAQETEVLKTTDFDPNERPERAKTQKQDSSAAPAVNVPGYEILGELGRGGMGVVYRARQQGLNRLVALKMILAKGHAGPDELRRFQAEAEAVAQLQHPNIVQIHEVGEQDGLPYFSLEFVDGGTLEALRDKKPMPPEEAARWLETLARAMQSAHQRGIVHRDLKPENVLITAEGVPKITDFGLAKRLEGDSSETKSGMVVGTPSYMSPEQAFGERDIGQSADVYALGAILYCLLTGRPPFLGTSPLDTVMQVRNNEPVRPAQLQPKIPRDVETICLKCLQKEPDRRYENAEALAEDLRRFQNGEPIVARPVGGPERLWRWTKRNPSLAAASFAAGVLALVLMIGGPTSAWMINEKKILAERNEQAALEAEAVAKQRQQETNAALQREQAALAKQKQALTSERLAHQKTKEANDRTFQALDDLAKTVPLKLRDRPGLQDLQRDIMKRALEGLGALPVPQQKDRRSRLILAKALKQRGDLMMSLGAPESALSQFERCHQVALRMTKDDWSDKPAMPYLFPAQTLGFQAQALQLLGENEKAEKYLHESIELRQKALHHPKVIDPLVCKQELALGYGQLGAVHLALGEPKQALEYYQESLKLRKQWSTKKNASARFQMAGAYRGVGDTYLQLGEVEKALEHHQHSLDILIETAKQLKNQISPQANVGQGWIEMGQVNHFAGRLDEAKTHYRKGLQIIETVQKRDEKRSDLKRYLASAHYAMGALCRQRHDNEEADRHFERSVALRKEIYEADKGNIRSKREYMLALARSGEHQQAAELAQQVRKSKSPSSLDLYDVACCYAQCAAAAKRKQADPSAKGDGLDGKYMQDALAVLAQAVEKGYRARAMLRMDPDLEPIRQRKDFQALMAKLETQMADAS